ncbi:carotenoid oxygenase family protein [Streptomyces sp. NPDC002156]
MLGSPRAPNVRRTGPPRPPPRPHHRRRRPDDLTSPAEPVFVARENARAEDDGYLLVLWWNRATNLSELLIHDAGELRRTPLARVKLPSRVPFGFHGSWADHHTLDRAIAAHRGDDRQGRVFALLCRTGGRGSGDPAPMT